MKALQFKCTLKSDVILNTKAATEGNQETLDFIPGNNFLGIVATTYNEFTPEEQMEIFHSGRVRFGDAHPAASSTRTLRIPASIYFPKGEKVSEKAYIHHVYSREKDTEGENHGPQQLKQCRTGFYAFTDNVAKPVTVDKSFAIKSAYDSDLRRSEDAKMYGYESVNAGAEFYFEVEVDNEAHAEKICSLLTGSRHIGRSRTAQYGLVEIKPAVFTQPASSAQPTVIDGKNFVCVYADSRLIFLDENGQPTFRPKASDLGVDGGEIDWEKSQVRTFQYAPWNFKRQNRDTDRCGIEKGSVFVVELDEGVSPKDSTYVGCYKNEGFGHVIYNPDFLRAKEATNGEVLYIIKEKENDENKNDKGKTTPLSDTSTPLLRYISAQQKERDCENFIYKKVNMFVKDNRNKFNDAAFASQWGKIRSIAMRCRSYDDIQLMLFSNEQKYERNATVTNDSTFEIKDRAYLSHGVAKDKWDKGGRRKLLGKWIEEIKAYGGQEADIVAKAVVNLASEMAKKSRKEEK